MDDGIIFHDANIAFFHVGAHHTPILQPSGERPCTGVACYALPLYYDLKGTPLGTTKPTAPGVYIEKHGKHVRKIAVR
jgi:hypothetical protein